MMLFGPGVEVAITTKARSGRKLSIGRQSLRDVPKEFRSMTLSNPPVAVSASGRNPISTLERGLLSG